MSLKSLALSWTHVSFGKWMNILIVCSFFMNGWYGQKYMWLACMCRSGVGVAKEHRMLLGCSIHMLESHQMLLESHTPM
jgi:hypothetical protein